MYLEEHGADIELIDDPDRADFREELGIPGSAASCHTALVDGYVIEGHVPVGAITTLLKERPEATGIVLPGMPLDSPGMGGDVSTWEAQPVQLVTNDGRLQPFDY